MTGTSESVAVIGVGTMGHGMAASTFARRDPDRRLGPLTGGDPRSCGAGRGSRGERRRHELGEPAIVVTMVPDADSGRRDCPRRGHAGGACSGSIWVQMEPHDRRGRHRAGVAALVEQERPDITLVDTPVSGSKDPAEHGELTIFRVGSRRGSGARHSPVRRASGHQTLWVGSVGTGTAREGREQYVAGVRGRSGRRFG